MGVADDPVLARGAAERIAQRLQAGGHTAYFAGGCVRDELLGLRPTDYDVATDARPDRIRELFSRTAEVGASFGVMLVHEGGLTIEVATFRRDGHYPDRRRPAQVHFADERADAERRDFTINALFLDPVAAADSPSIHGHVVDHVGGMADLKAGVVRAVGSADDRLAEDHLRALRAARFAARLGFSLDAATASAIRSHASELAGVSRERVGEELRRMLSGPARADAARLLGELLLDGPTLDEAHDHGPTPLLAALAPSACFVTALSAWALDRGALGGLPTEADAGEWARRVEALVARRRAALCLSNEQSAGLRATLQQFDVVWERWEGLGEAARKRAASGAGFAEALSLLAGAAPDAHARVLDDVRTLKGRHGGLNPDPLVTGDDLIGAGFRPGPSFGGLLASVYDAQLEGRVRTLAEALDFAREHSGESGV